MNPESRSIPGLGRLARIHGVQTRYRDLGGTWRHASPEALEAVLRGLGVDARDQDEVRRATLRRVNELDERILEPSTFVDLAPDDRPPEVTLRVPASRSNEDVTCSLQTEDGTVLEWRATPRRLEPATAGGTHSVRGRIPLPQPIPPGYHELRVSVDGQEARTRLLAAPPETWRPPEEQNVREWGVFLPLYALRSDTSWGTGHLGDLERLFHWIDELGGATVGTLPMLAGEARSAADAPVYSPVSRLFWNEVYADIETSPELQRSAEAKRLLESSDFQKRIEALRDRDEVDWHGAMEAKQAVLGLMAREAMRNGIPDRMASFLEARPEVKAYARFRATWASRGEPWGSWPEELRRPPLDLGAGDDDVFRYHLYVQWLMDRQLKRLRDGRGGGDAGLYLDLPVGTHPDGFDVWRHQDLFAQGIAVGSPPDAFFSKGQNWGFPPARPDRMEQSGFAYTIAALRNHMRFASRLRLDHVMGLHRLFWIPDGMTAADGVYVRYPHEALYAALRIESHRHRTAIVGEDLGTVPREVRRALARDRIDRMYVAQFEARAGKKPALPHPPSRSVYSLNTHDSPTFAGFWKGADIEVRTELGFVDPEEADAERSARDDLLAAWARFLADQGSLDNGAALRDPERVLRGTLRHAARSRASLLLVNLEDLWLEERPQNVPGTGSERPNFRRKARMSLEEITTDEDIREFLGEMDHLRGPPPPPEGDP
ncbi:MAG: 4-alpha-glucanotransferase [Gemmatimonadota bacterium]